VITYVIELARLLSI